MKSHDYTIFLAVLFFAHQNYQKWFKKSTKNQNPTKKSHNFFSEKWMKTILNENPVEENKRGVEKRTQQLGDDLFYNVVTLYQYEKPM